MSTDQHSAPVLQFDDVSVAFVMRVTVVVGILAIAAAIWLSLGPAHGVVAVSLLAGGFIYVLHVMAREWVTLSDDSENLELLRGEKALLRTLQRMPWDNNWLRAAMAITCAVVGAVFGVLIFQAQMGEGVALGACLWTVLFLGFYTFIKLDQILAKSYVERGVQALAEGDLAAAIGDASECLLLSTKYRYEAFMLRGQIWMEVGDLERSQREFQLAWSQRPGCEAARTAYRAAVNAALPNAESADAVRFTHFEHLLPPTVHSPRAHQDN